MKPPYTIEELLLILESARMDDVSDRLRELWAEMVTDKARLMMALEHAEPWLDGLSAGDEIRAAIQKVTK